ncbi:dimethyl sulfoxide reductase anchor subunit [Paramagnetospirillum magneticum]|uniref:dimethyl sulfoxide reductase anchor subunit n=1 Tax=Paramagnetospirillum magneticum TaxID=84159 RepID=UPI000326BA5B|nr:dimethyl sulfoxide reductase anchor subunit [Paramagnetospirillum magneticum]
MRQMITARLQRSWDLRAAGNFIGGGAGTGLVLASVLLGDGGLSLVAGLALVGLGLAMVWLEIGKPWRALNVFFHPQTSWMTREGIVAGPLMAVGGGYWLLGHPALLVPLVVLAAGFLYCQSRILRASRGIPAWKQAEIVPLIITSGLAEGAGLLALFAEPAPAVLAWALAAGLAREGAWMLYRRGLVASGNASGALAIFGSGPAQAARMAQGLALALWLLALAGLPVAPLAGLLAAGSGWGIKALLITRAAFTRGASVPYAPVRGRGLPMALGGR